MKIRDVVVEGFWGAAGNIVGAGLKGVAKGVADVVAPGSVDQIKSVRNSANIDKIAPSMEKYNNDKEAQAILDQLLKQAQANGGNMNFDDVKAAAAGQAGVSEAQGQFNPQLTAYLIMKLQSAGVTIKGMPQAAGEKTPKEKKVPGFTVTQWDPLVVQYKKTDYTLNDNGEWVYLGSAKVLNNPQLERMLDLASGHTSAPKQTVTTKKETPPGTVVTPTGDTVVKNEKGEWWVQAQPTNKQVVDPKDIKELERRDLVKRQTAQMAQAKQ